MESTLSSGTVLTLNLQVRLAYLKVLQSTSSLRWPFACYQFTTFVPFAGEPFFLSYEWRNVAFGYTYESFHQASIKLSSNLMCCAFACWKHGETLQEDVINHKWEERCVSAWFLPVYISTISLNEMLLLIGAKVVLVKFQFEYITRKGEGEFGVKVWWSWCRALIPGAQVNS